MLAALLVTVSCQLRAQSDTDLRLERITLYQLARVVLGEVLRVPYVVEGGLIASDEVATVDVRSVSPSAARAILEGLLRSRGFELGQEGAVTVVRRRVDPKEPEVMFTYRPKFRSVAYLQGAVRSFVARGRFAGAAAAAAPSGTAIGQPGQPGYAPAASAAVPAQSGVTGVIPVSGAVLASQDVLMFEGSAADVEKVSRLVADLDVRAREVVVRAHVFEVGSTSSDGSAVTLALNLLKGKLLGSASTGSFPYSLGVNIGGIDVAFSILQSDGRFKVVSSPTLRIKNGEHGKLTVGSEVPVLGAVSVNSAGQALQSVEYRSSGVIFDLRPEVFEASIYLTIQEQVSSFVNTVSGVNGSPTLLKRELVSNLGVKSGEVIVLGGLEESRTTAARSGLPGFLSFLQSKSLEESRSEIILLLEARSLDGSE